MTVHGAQDVSLAATHHSKGESWTHSMYFYLVGWNVIARPRLSVFLVTQDNRTRELSTAGNAPWQYLYSKAVLLGKNSQLRWRKGQD